MPQPKYFTPTRTSPSVALAKDGFTLIELLIVVSIVSILAVIGLANYRSVSQRARDDARRADIAAIQQALEQVYAEEGTYPWDAGCDSSRGTHGNGDCPAGSLTGNDWDGTGGGTNNLGYLEANGFIDDLPLDPNNDQIGNEHFYRYEPQCGVRTGMGPIEPTDVLCGQTVSCPAPATDYDGSDISSINCCAYELSYYSEVDGELKQICNSHNAIITP